MTDRAGPVLLYDGLCGFCDLTVRAILRVDRRGVFRFAPLDGAFAASALARYPELRGTDSVVLVERGAEGETTSASARSTAFLRTAHHLGGVWRLLGVFVVIPRPLRDWAYDVFARCRYRIFGRFDACPVPPAEVRRRFLD
jgi:predicted DCC family thiol-disulfide oxidoreductase YuxK